jgi:hypothetical protein
MFSLQTIFGQGMQFYTLLEAAANAAHDSTKALHEMLKDSKRAPSLDAFKLARQREREASNKISQELVNSFITPIEREDIERWVGAVQDPQAGREVRRPLFAGAHPPAGIDFRAARGDAGAGGGRRGRDGPRPAPHEDRAHEGDERRLRSIEMKPDRLMLELYRDIYSGKLDHLQMFLLKEFFEILEKAIDRCREAAWSPTKSC